MSRFSRTVAIDWSGAKGRRHKGIALAEARPGEPPRLIRPDHVWSRTEVADWLLVEAEHEPTLFGFDFSFAPPFLTRGSYLPGEPGLPDTAPAFWAYVESTADDEDLGAASFLEHRHRRHFYFGASDGRKADYMHFRQCEQRFNAGGGGKAATVFDAIGAAQVAKASFAGMRLLHRVSGQVPVWPFQPISGSGSMIVEIYGRAFIRHAGLPGRKLRTAKELNDALRALNAPVIEDEAPLTDHQTDALVTAAGMLFHLEDPKAFTPNGMTDAVAQTEGWTFGVV